MTAFQQAEYLFDAAERETQAAKYMESANREYDAHRHYLRARECQQQAHLILDQVIDGRPHHRVAG